MSLPPPPSRERLPVTKDQAGNYYAEFSQAWLKYFSGLTNSVSTIASTTSTAASILWATVSKVGSKLTDLEIRNHNDLQSIQGGQSQENYHLTAIQNSLIPTGTPVAGQVPIASSDTTSEWGDIVNSITFPILSFSDGEDGNDGINGMIGATGVNGLNGTNGLDGEDGEMSYIMLQQSGITLATARAVTSLRV